MERAQRRDLTRLICTSHEGGLRDALFDGLFERCVRPQTVCLSMGICDEPCHPRRSGCSEPMTAELGADEEQVFLGASA